MRSGPGQRQADWAGGFGSVVVGRHEGISTLAREQTRFHYANMKILLASADFSHPSSLALRELSQRKIHSVTAPVQMQKSLLSFALERRAGDAANDP